MNIWSSVSCLCLLICLAMAGCGPAGGNESVQRDEIEQAATRIYAAVPAEEDQPGLIQTGQKFFRRAGCESCHSVREDRMGLMGPPLGGLPKRLLERHSDDELESRRWLIKHIKSPHLYPSPYVDDEQYEGMQMPAYAKFNDEDMRALVEFLWSLR